MENVIEVRGLVNCFGGRVVHDQLSLDVHGDEILGVVGGSGSGKSVLMRSILGLQKPAAGSITVLGQKIEYHKPGPTRHWGVLFQGGALLSGLTVQENVELPMALHSDMPVETRHELASLKLLMAGLSLSVADMYPSQLSGGMRKRVSLARALALEPRILFLDEPTAGLGMAGTSQLMELVLKLKQRYTMVIIEHDMRFLFRLADTISVIHWGQVIAQGTPEELRADPWVAASEIGAAS
jgi:phospholipid/cholesterol/gamma-HCH transport system ATP-binding protein